MKEYIMKQIKKAALALITAASLALSPVAIPYTPVISQVQAATVKLNTTKATLYTGNTMTLKIAGTTSKISWTSSSPKVAKVSGKGVVTGLKAGHAAITASVGGKKYTCSITVKKPSINQSALKLSNGDTANLTVKGAVGSLTWKSSNPKVAAVSSKGLVTAKSVGTATVTASGKHNTYTCRVTVIKKVSRISSSAAAITLNQESYVTVTLKNSTQDDTVLYDVANENVVSCKWGDWADDEDSLKLYLIPKKKGTTTVTVKTKTGTDKATFQVTVGTDSRASATAPEATKIAEKCSPSVVQITTDIGIGTGFFIDKGVIATNYHVIKGASIVSVELKDGKEYTVKTILGYDEDLDMALLSLPGVGTPLTISKFAPKAGDTAYAIGSPMGLENTFSKGIISNASRIAEDVDYIQTDTALSTGNSGGPLLNAFGEVIGINTMQYSEGQNLNFALNITQLYRISTLDPVPVSSLTEDSDTDYSKITINEDTSKSKSIATAQDLPDGYYVTGTIDPSADSIGTDSYRITLDKYSRIGVMAATTTEYPTDLKNMHLIIADSNNKAILYDYTDDDSDGFLNIFADLPAGTYYIQVCTMPGKIYVPLPYFIFYNQYKLK